MVYQDPFTWITFSSIIVTSLLNLYCVFYFEEISRRTAATQTRHKPSSLFVLDQHPRLGILRDTRVSLNSVSRRMQLFSPFSYFNMYIFCIFNPHITTYNIQHSP